MVNSLRTYCNENNGNYLLSSYYNFCKVDEISFSVMFHSTHVAIYQDGTWKRLRHIKLNYLVKNAEYKEISVQSNCVLMIPSFIAVSL